MLGVDENDELIDPLKEDGAEYGAEADLRPDDPGEPQDRRRAAGAQGRQDHLHLAHALAGRSGLRRRPLHRKGDGPEKRAAIFIGPEFGTVSAPIWSPPPARRAMPASTC